MRGQDDKPLADLATEQDGVLGRRQLLALGLSARAIDHRISTGRLHVKYRGVYTLGHRTLTPRGHLIAAVLAGGAGAVASHRSAAWLHGLLASSRPRHEVTVRTNRKRDGIDLYRRELRDDEVTAVEGIRCTTVARTLLDLAAVVPPRLVERAVEQAEIRRTLDLDDLAAVLSRANGRKGTRTLREFLEQSGGRTVTRSELEERFLALVRRHRLPLPLLNVHVEGFEVDAFWPARRLIVELDGAETHLTRQAFERDRQRDQALTAAGYRVVRFTWRQVTTDPKGVARTLRTLLS